MPHALLLSPDDQAVSAITGVLEEMSVTCERPLDGVSAAQKLNSQTFDLVLVDCENLPAAKLIFDVCRRGKNGNNPVPIAIVDGRAGLPTAFRLGAELILTKPVAKDQARTTIRTAVSRIKKDDGIRPIQPVETASEEIAAPAVAETRAQAVAAPASSPKSIDINPLSVSAPAPSARMQPATEEVASAAPKMERVPPREPSAPATASTTVKSSPPVKLQEELTPDPVLEDLEVQSDLPTPVFSSYREPVKKS